LRFAVCGLRFAVGGWWFEACSLLLVSFTPLQNYETTVYYHGCAWVMWATAGVYSMGFCFRAAVYRNRWLLLYFTFVFLFNSVMLLLPSHGRRESILKSPALYGMNTLEAVFKMMPMPDDFKLQLYALLCCCSIGMTLTEWCLFKMFQKSNGRTPLGQFAEKTRNYVWIPLMRALSRGKLFKFRSVADGDGVECHVDMGEMRG